MQNIDSIIFDVDGTLWDSVAVCAKAWNHVIRENSDLPANVKPEQLQQLFGKPMDEIFQAVFPGITKEQIDFLGQKCEVYENELLLTEPGKVYPAVPETMRELSKYVKLYVVSNCQKGYIEVCCKCLGVEDIILDHACFGDNHVSKGENIKLLVQKNSLKNPVYVGDTQGDANACKEAGIPMIYASYGFGKVENPYVTIDKFSDLLTFLLS